MKTIIKYDVLYFKKTSKFIVFGILGVFLAGFSALTAKYFNLIIEFSLGQEGIDVTLPEPTVLESYTQFFSNFTQIYVFVLMFVAIMFFIQDKTRGHYPLLFTKPLYRSHYLLSKSIVITATVVVSYFISALFFGYYTYFLFGEFDVGLFLIASLAFIAFMVLMVHLGLVFSVVFKTYLGAIMVPIAIFILFGLLTPLDGGIMKYFPQHLLVYPVSLMDNSVAVSVVVITSLIALVISGGLIYLSIKLFQSKSLI